MADIGENQQRKEQDRKREREQAGGLENQDITRPASIDRTNDEKKQPEPADLVNRNLTKPGLTE